MHLYPADEELWTEDLLWAMDLLKKKKVMQDALTTELEKENKKAQITELDSEEETNHTNLDVVPIQSSRLQSSSVLADSKKTAKQKQDNVQLDNYVKMRD